MTEYEKGIEEIVKTMDDSRQGWLYLIAIRIARLDERRCRIVHNIADGLVDWNTLK